MKLRNKKTGEKYEMTMPIVFNIKTSGGGEHTVSCKSIKELNEKWADCEEPKEYWYIYADKPQRADCGDILEEDFKAIGNHFEAKEEAEKAVEKLKAWKRLKDKGFRIRRNNYHDGMMYLHIWNDTTDEPTPLDKNSETFKDLDLLFGGEE